jgi:hypothetical protein
MSRSRYIESGLYFEFDPTWIVQKYDEHRYYSYFSGAGLKGVDFAAIRAGKAYLFEVKNYQIRFEGKPSYRIYDFIDNPEQLVELIISKVEDTHRGITIVHEYLSRKWLYRRLYPYYCKWPIPAWAKNTWWFWAKLYAQLDKPNGSTIVLSIAVEQTYEGYKENQVAEFIHVLKRRLSASMTAKNFAFELMLVGDEQQIKGLRVYRYS